MDRKTEKQTDGEKFEERNKDREKENTVKNLSNEIEGTSKFVCYRQISLQPV